MNSQEPLKTSNIEFTKIVYPKFRSNKNKKIILVKYNYKNFVFQTPTLINVSTSEFANGYSELEVALHGKGKDQLKINNFIKFLNDLEDKIKLDAQDNASSWFNINDNQTINFQKIIRESDNYPNGTIKIKIINNNDFKTLLQLNNNKKIDISSIPQEAYCKMILECYAIWINSNNDFGLFFRPVLVSFSPKDVYNYKFLEESDEDNDNDFEMPDTEVNNNIFLKIGDTNKTILHSSAKHDCNAKSYDSTSQLDLQELVKQIDKNISDDRLSTSSTSTSISKEQDSLQNLSIIDIDNNTEQFFDNSSSDNDYEDNSQIDAETSDN
jgi:hypothetical protein